MKKLASVVGSLAVLGLAFAGAAQAQPAITLKPNSKKSIRGDVLWMRLTDETHEALAPSALDYKGRQCWAPAAVFEESCTVTVTRKAHGKRTLSNGSQVDVRVTYAREF